MNVIYRRKSVFSSAGLRRLFQFYWDVLTGFKSPARYFLFLDILYNIHKIPLKTSRRKFLNTKVHCVVLISICTLSMQESLYQTKLKSEAKPSV